jgi:hypothetical protein
MTLLHPALAKSRGNTGLSSLFTVKPCTCRAALCERRSTRAAWTADIVERQGFENIPLKRKTRPGGQPDGSSYMGAWGGWALAPNTASMGRDNRSHINWSPQGRRTFKRRAIFLTFWQEFSERFQAKACPALDAGWRPVRVRKTRQIKNLEPRFDSIETEKALAGKSLRGGAIGFASGRFV